MRRRKGNNKLLVRIIMISVLVHVLTLPILAHYGAFKKIQQHFIETRLVQLPPPERERAHPPERKVERHTAKTARSAHHATQSASRQAHTAHSNVNQPKVVASAQQGGDSGEGDVDANGTGKVGQIPTAAPASTKPPEKETTAPPPATTPAPKPSPLPEPVNVASAAPVAPTQPKVEKPMPAHVPVFTEVEAIDSPQPTIPDDLRGDALDKTFVAEFDVSPDGTPSNVKVAQSTGSDELDQIALDAARKWRFRPATRDGEPVASKVRLHIEFQVN